MKFLIEYKVSRNLYFPTDNFHYEVERHGEVMKK